MDDTSVLAYIRAAISEVYQRNLITAAKLVNYKINYVPNNKFTVLCLGVPNSGKSSFLARLMKAKHI